MTGVPTYEVLDSGSGLVLDRAVGVLEANRVLDAQRKRTGRPVHYRLTSPN